MSTCVSDRQQVLLWGRCLGGWGAMPHALSDPAAWLSTACSPWACTCVWFASCWTLPQGRLPVPCVGTGRRLVVPLPQQGWWCTRWPCLLVELQGAWSASQGWRASSLCPVHPQCPLPACHQELTAGQCTQPARGSWAPRALQLPCTHPHLPVSAPSWGWSARSCFLSLKPSRDTCQTAPSL